MNNADRRYLRATATTIERLLVTIINVTDAAIDTYAESPAELPLRDLHTRLRIVLASSDLRAVREAGAPNNNQPK